MSIHSLRSGSETLWLEYLRLFTKRMEHDENKEKSTEEIGVMIGHSVDYVPNSLRLWWRYVAHVKVYHWYHYLL